MEAELNGIGWAKQCPGHIHLINGLYDNKAGNPVIAIASTIHTKKWTRQLSRNKT
jgi:hypothetical protein